MCARCLNEGMFTPGAKRLRRKAQSVDVPSVILPNVDSESEIEIDKLQPGLNFPSEGNLLTTTWSTPFPLVINMTISVTVLIANLFLMQEIEPF